MKRKFTFNVMPQGRWRSYHLISDPKRKCCMIGTFSSTSALYIFSIPLFTLLHVGTALMSSSIGECSANTPFFTFFTKATQAKYI